MEFQIPVPLSQKTIGDSAPVDCSCTDEAKVTLDRLMVKCDKQFPGYGFAEHKGYGCAAHLAAIAELGPCHIHRKTFRGVKEHLQAATEFPLSW
jgi:ribonuclease HII